MKYFLAFLLISCTSDKIKTPGEAPPLIERPEFIVLTLDTMDDFDGSVLQYVMDAPQLKNKLSLALRKNRELCKQGHDVSCEKIDQLKTFREDLHQGLIDITWIKSCSTHTAIKERKNLTKVLDPRLASELNVYRSAYKQEAGQALDLRKCEVP